MRWAAAENERNENGVERSERETNRTVSKKEASRNLLESTLSRVHVAWANNAPHPNTTESAWP